MMTPMIHLNGSSRERLLEQQTDAAAALREALEALVEASPNGRDYYPQGSGAVQAAMREHEDRLRRIQSVLCEIEALAEAISEAGR